jgi:RNA polymerase sigma-70 factor, ECF subfamily
MDAAADLSVLLVRIAQRDREAFRALYRSAAPKLMGIVTRIVNRGDIASEVLQESFVKIWDKASEFDVAKGSPMAWMATIARNRALDEVRRVRPKSLEDMPEGFEPVADTEDPLASRERSERLAALMRCLGQLDPQKRQIVMLAYYHGASREALAKQFNAPTPTIKTWLHRSLAQLRGCLEP